MHPSRREEPPSELGLVHLVSPEAGHAIVAQTLILVRAFFLSFWDGQFYLFERAIDLMPKHVE